MSAALLGLLMIAVGGLALVGATLLWRNRTQDDPIAGESEVARQRLGLYKTPAPTTPEHPPVAPPAAPPAAPARRAPSPSTARALHSESGVRADAILDRALTGDTTPPPRPRAARSDPNPR